MSGNQESGVKRLPTWLCSDFNGVIPIKKRKYFVQLQLPAVEGAGCALLELNTQPNEQCGDTSVARSGLDSSDTTENQKVIGGSKANVLFVSTGNADEAEISGQIIVKVEEPSFPVHSSSLTDCVSTCTKSGNDSGVNRSNWDLNTTMDDWEDGLNSNKSLHGIETSKSLSDVSTVSGGNGNLENPENVSISSPVSFKEEISTIDNDPPMELSEGSQSRRIINLTQVSNKSPIKTLDASGSFLPVKIERERLPDFPFESQRYLSRGSDERYHGKVMRSPRSNFMPDRRRYSDQTESNLHDRDTKNFEFDNHGNTRRGGAFNFRRGRRPAEDEGTPFSNSFQRRTPNFSFRGPRNKEDTSAFPGFRDAEKATRGLQSNYTEPVYLNSPRPYRGRNGDFARGRTNNPGYRSRSPVRSRERSSGPSSSFRNRSQEEFSGQTDFSHRRSPSGYRTERTTSSPDHTGYPRETVVRRHYSPPYSHRPSNAGRGRGFARGRGYGRAGFSFRKPYDRIEHGNMNNLNPRERVNYNDDFLEGPIHSERFDVDVNVERRRFGYRHDGTNYSFNKDGCAPSNVENEPDAVRFGQDSHIEADEQGGLLEIDGQNKNSAENASGGTKNMDEEETSMETKFWQRDEVGGDGF